VITVCVLLSAVLWFSLTLMEERMQELRLPVEIGEMPAGQALAERPPSSVQVEVEGQGLDLLRLLYNPPVVPVDATTNRVNVEEAINISQGSSVRLEGVTPASFEVALDSLSTRRVPVHSRARVTLEEAHELINPPELNPDSVQVRGAESVVSEVEAWPTDSIKIDNLGDTVEVRAPLQDPPKGLAEVTPESVRLVARAGRFAKEKREVEVGVTGVPSGQDLVSLQPASVRVQYRVLFEDMFKARRSSEFFATVSYDRIRSDTTGYVTPRVGVPTDLLIRDPEPVPSRLRYYTFISEN
jgi:hypothetical protein